MRLAALLGYANVDEMLDRLTPEEFAEWRAFFVIEPPAPERILSTLRLGFAAVCNSLGAKIDPEVFLTEAEREDFAEDLTGTEAARLFSSGAVSGKRDW